MKEIWEQATLAHNLPLTILLGMVVVYWLLALVGTIDIDALDIDLDIGSDGDLDADVTPSNLGCLGSALKFVNATDIPVMMVLSLLTLLMWGISIFSNAALNPSGSTLLATGLLVGNFFVSCVIVKFITQPLRPMLRAFKKGENDDEPVIGQIGTVKSRVIDGKYGQVEIPRQNGAPAIVNSRMGDGHPPQTRGSEVLVFDHDSEKKLYIVRPALPADKTPTSSQQQF